VLNKKLEFKKFMENIYSNIGGVVAHQFPQIGLNNSDWTKSDVGGGNPIIRSNISANMKKKMKKK
jgi:hypothetical protein